MIDLENIKTGDRIEFRSPTWGSDRKVWRVVTGHEMRRTHWTHRENTTADLERWPTVRFNGHGDFVVRPHEIFNIEKKPDR